MCSFCLPCWNIVCDARRHHHTPRVSRRAGDDGFLFFKTQCRNLHLVRFVRDDLPPLNRDDRVRRYSPKAGSLERR